MATIANQNRGRLQLDRRFRRQWEVSRYTLDGMDWEHKGIHFTITTEALGSFVMASARVPREGRFVRIRPFSALGGSEDEALEMLKDQIRMEYRRVPTLAAGS